MGPRVDNGIEVSFIHCFDEKGDLPLSVLISVVYETGLGKLSKDFEGGV